MKLHLPKTLFAAVLACFAVGASYGVGVSSQVGWSVSDIVAAVNSAEEGTPVTRTWNGTTYTYTVSDNMLVVSGYELSNNVLSNITFQADKNLLQALGEGCIDPLVHIVFAGSTAHTWGVNVKGTAEGSSSLFTGQADGDNDWSDHTAPRTNVSGMADAGIVSAYFNKSNAPGVSLANGYTSATDRSDCIYYAGGLRWSGSNGNVTLKFNTDYVTALIYKVDSYQDSALSYTVTNADGTWSKSYNSVATAVSGTQVEATLVTGGRLEVTRLNMADLNGKGGDIIVGGSGQLFLQTWSSASSTEAIVLDNNIYLGGSTHGEANDRGILRFGSDSATTTLNGTITLIENSTMGSNGSGGREVYINGKVSGDYKLTLVQGKMIQFKGGMDIGTLEFGIGVQTTISGTDAEIGTLLSVAGSGDTKLTVNDATLTVTGNASEMARLSTDGDGVINISGNYGFSKTGVDFYTEGTGQVNIAGDFSNTGGKNLHFGANVTIGGTFTTNAGGEVTGLLTLDGVYAAASNILTTSGGGQIVFGRDAKIDVSRLTAEGGGDFTVNGFIQESYRVTASGVNASIEGDTIALVDGDLSLGNATWENGAVVMGGAIYNVAGTKSYTDYLSDAQASGKEAVSILVQQGGTFTADNADQTIAIAGTGTLSAAWSGRAGADAGISRAAGTFHGAVEVQSGTGWIIGDGYSFSSLTVKSGGQLGLGGTYTGDITISGTGVAAEGDQQGALMFGDGGSLVGNVTISGNKAALSTKGAGSIQGNITSGTEGVAELEILNGNVTTADNTITLTGNLSGINKVTTTAASMTVSGTVSDFGGTFTKSGTGTLTVGNSIGNGTLNVAGGTLSVGGISTGTTAADIASGAIFALTGTVEIANRSSLTTSGQGTLQATTLRSTGGTVELTANASITGGGNGQGDSSRKQGLAVTGANGTISIQGGTTTVSGATYVGSNGGTLNVGTGETSATLVTTRLELGDSNGGTSTLEIGAKGTVVVTSTNDSSSYPDTGLILSEWNNITTANISGKLLAKDVKLYNGDSRFILNINTGGEVAVKGIAQGKTGLETANEIHLNGGKLVLGSDGITSTGSGTWTIALDGGEVGMSADTMEITRNITLGGTVNFNTAKYSFSGTGAGQELKEGTVGGTMSISGVVSDKSVTENGTTTLTAGKLVKDGAGTLVLSGANTYSGGTEVNAGTLEVRGNGTLGTGAISVGAEGALSLNGNVTISKTILNDGTITFGTDASLVISSLDGFDSGVTSYSEGENGYACGMYVIIKSSDTTKTSTVTGLTGATIEGKDQQELTFDNETGSYTYTTAGAGGAYYVNSDTVVYGGTGDNANSAASDSTTGIVLNGGNLTLQQGLTTQAKEGTGIVAQKAATVKIGEGVTLSKSHLTANAATTLDGSGTYDLGATNSLGANVSLADSWSGSVTGLTGNDGAVSLSDFCKSNSSVTYAANQTVGTLNCSGGTIKDTTGLRVGKLDAAGGTTIFDASTVTVTSSIDMRGSGGVYNGKLKLLNGSTVEITGSGIWGNPQSDPNNSDEKIPAITVDSTSAFKDNSFTINGISTTHAAELVLKNSNGTNAHRVNEAISIKNAVITSENTVGRTISSQLTNSKVINSGSGTLTLSNDANQLSALEITNGGISVTGNLTVGSKSNDGIVTTGVISMGNGTQLTIANGKALTYYTTVGESKTATMTIGALNAGNATITSSSASGNTTLGIENPDMTFANSDVVIDTSANVTTAATLAGSKLTVTGGGSVKTEVAQDSTNSFDASQGNVTVDTGSAAIAKVENLTVGAGKEATFATENGAAAGVVVSGTADVAGTVSADVTVQSGNNDSPATFTANNGAEVGGNLTVTESGKLTIAGGAVADNALTVNGTMQLTANSVLDFTELSITKQKETQTFTIAKAEEFSIDAATRILGLDNLSWTLTNNAGDELLSSTTSSGGTNPAAPAMFSMRNATDTLTLTVLGTDAPVTLTATAVGTSYSDGTLNINVNPTDLTQYNGKNLAVKVDSEAWKSIVAAMSGVDGGVYNFATITLNNTTLDNFGTVSFNGYAGTGTKGEYFVAYIPEPATATLSLLALAALAARRRRK